MSGPNDTDASADAGSEPGESISQFDGPAALLRPSPWQLTSNAAFDELLGRTARDRSGLHRAFGAAGVDLTDRLARRQPFQARLRIEPGPKTPLPGLLHADLAPLPGRDDWLITLVDISATAQAGSRNALTLHRLRHTLDQLDELISMIDHEETMLFVNMSYAQFFGTTPEDAPGRSARQVLGEDNYKLTTPSRRELFQTLRPVRYERILLDHNGEDRVMGILLWPILDRQGRLAKMATLTRDVTLRHRGLQALRRTLERLDALFEAGIEGILLCEHGRVTDANPVACRYLERSREALIGLPLAQALEPLGLSQVDAVREGDGEWDLHLCLRPGEGDSPPLLIQSVALADESRPGHAVLLQDMTYRRQAQGRIDRLVSDLRQQTARAEAADRSKSVFLASASHDLRQPIHSLSLFLTTIQSLSRLPHPVNGEALKPIAQLMRSSLDGLMELLEMLLGASMVEADRAPLVKSPVPLQTCFDDMVAEFGALAASKGLSLRAAPSRAWVLADGPVLRRILANLVSNAVRYTERGRVLIGARSRGQQIEIQVWDTGVGIADAQLEAIFETFYRVESHPSGGERSEGLGLSIVKRAVGQLGATMDLRSTPGRGSVFCIRLARSTPQSVPADLAMPAPRHPAGTGKRVLLIDDDQQVMEATVCLLESWGHEVLSATSAHEAIALCESTRQPIDAVICDYMLDPSIDALALLLRLRQQHSGPLPVCMVTGDVSTQRIEQARRYGFELLHKPVNAADLERFLHSVR